jgi:acetyl-CoA carboxylase beta subunit
MSWISYITGGMTVILAYAFYAVGMEDEEEELAVEDNNLMVNDFSGRYVTLSCQTCRKLKRHQEVEPNLFQCTKCKRHVDIRESS